MRKINFVVFCFEDYLDLLSMELLVLEIPILAVLFALSLLIPACRARYFYSVCLYFRVSDITLKVRNSDARFASAKFVRMLGCLQVRAVHMCIKVRRWDAILAMGPTFLANRECSFQFEDNSRVVNVPWRILATV